MARWRRGRGRPAGGDRRQWHGQGPDLPRRQRSGSRLGGIGYRYHWRRAASSSSPIISAAPRSSRGRCRPYARHPPTCRISSISKGQESAKRALEVAAAGGHNLLMVGPPGSGKSMLAARLPSILPPLSAGRTAGSLDDPLDRRPAFRRQALGSPSLSHSASFGDHGGARSAAGLKRQGRARPRSAHHGILFLDEFPEFSPQVARCASASRWKPANASSPAPITGSPIPPASSWSPP